MYDSIIILGPTATGKTKISIELAKILKTDIVNADSMYIYKQLSIGTAKPTIEEMSGVVHHVIDVANPQEAFNVVNYRELAKTAIENIQSRGLCPIIVGGTGFYIDSLIKDYDYGAPYNQELREKLMKELEDYGKQYMYDKLLQENKELAQKLNVNDSVRVIRGLENCYNPTNPTKAPQQPILKNPLIIGLNCDRDILYDRINLRVDIMVKNGLIQEVSELINIGLTPNQHQSMKGIGYQEIYNYLQGECSLDIAINKIKQHTRNYAKRQITWFKRNENIIWINPLEDAPQQIANYIMNLYNDCHN